MSTSKRKLVADIYCEVLFDLAEQNDQMDSVLDEIHDVAGVINSQPEFASILTSQSLPVREKVDIFTRVFRGHVSELTLNFLCVLARRNRVGLLAHICDRYEMMLDAYEQKHYMEVTLPYEVEDAKKQELRQRLCEAVGGKVKMVVHADSDIIGGMRVQRGETLVDSTVRSALQNAVGTIVEKARERIRGL